MPASSKRCHPRTVRSTRSTHKRSIPQENNDLISENDEAELPKHRPRLLLRFGRQQGTSDPPTIPESRDVNSPILVENEDQPNSQASTKTATDTPGICPSGTIKPRIVQYAIEVAVEKEVLGSDTRVYNITEDSNLDFLEEKLENCMNTAYSLAVERDRRIRPVQLDVTVNSAKCRLIPFRYTFCHYEVDKCIQNIQEAVNQLFQIGSHEVIIKLKALCLYKPNEQTPSTSKAAITKQKSKPLKRAYTNVSDNELQDKEMVKIDTSDSDEPSKELKRNTVTTQQLAELSRKRLKKTMDEESRIVLKLQKR
jgi:hypothetical protein